MRRYTVTVDGTAFTIDVEETAADRFAVTVDGRTYEASLETAGDLPGATITPGMPAAAPAVLAAAAAPAPASSPGSVPTPATSSAPSAHPHAGTASASRGPLVTAPMPGVVLEVHVAPGVIVHRGDPLLILEAMKMRNTIRAPRDGVVIEVTTEAGRPVTPGEPLVRLGDATS